MTNEFVPVVVLAALAVVFVLASLAVSALVRPRKPTIPKREPYECGIEPTRLPKSERFPVKFYVVAMLFIVFDIEAIFLYPWAVEFRALGFFGLMEMAVFIGLVFVAYLYVWQKGGLSWEPPRRIPTDRLGVSSMPAAVERGPGEYKDEERARVAGGV
jgi:NADH-quinone oxidoreductase subunit A